jgi:dolichol-phosphate mannosyltransferase
MSSPASQRPLCSVIVPAKNEAENLGATLSALAQTLRAEAIPHEILVVNEVGADGDPKTRAVIEGLSSRFEGIRLIENQTWNQGIGKAIALGLDQLRGDCVAIVMADGCDDPKDLVRYYAGICEGYDCVFGSRFMRGGEVLNYPKNKLLVNRLANWFLACLFFVPYQDFTNAFKIYSRATIEGLKPILSPHFGIMVELPLKAIARGYSWKVVPNRWYGQKSKVSNLRIGRMASRYLYVSLVVFLERLLARDDYAKKHTKEGPSWRAS